MLEDILQRRPYNAAADFVDANIDRGLGQKIAFTDGGRSLTYADLQDGSYRFASALSASGLREETRVILIFHDTVDYPVAFWGAIRAGIIPIPVNTLLNAEQYAYLFADSRAAATVVAAPSPAAASAHGDGRRSDRTGSGGIAGRAFFRGRAERSQGGAVHRTDGIG
jgi:4-hydroxybenzoate-CoA ligase